MATRLSETTAARPVVDPEQMLNDQRQILRRILHKTYDIAEYEIAQEQAAGKREDYLRAVRSRRPRQVFFIDGSRGAGKTSLLLTIRECLAYLGKARAIRGPDDLESKVSTTLTTFENKISDEATEIDRKATAFSFAKPHKGQGGDRQTACLLEILFPSDLEGGGGQPVMEGIFAFMANKLLDEIKDLKGAGEEIRQKRERAQKLANRIHDDVSRGWYLSKHEGADAIVRDSADYKDYLRKMGEASIASYSRVNSFRDFLYDYLDHFNAELLVVFFDDTDVSPVVTHDILHTIRIFLDHPRVVTVVAGHLKSMRESLLWQAMTELKNPIDAEKEGPGSNADTWRQFQHHQVEEYLEKVLPRQYRYLIRVERLNELGGSRVPQREGKYGVSGTGQTGKKGDRDHNGGDKSKVPSNPAQADFKAIFGMPFDPFCASMQDRMLSEFTIAKMQAYQRVYVGRLGAADDRELSSLENWIAWWLFRHRYAEQLKPRSVRLKISMRAMFSPAEETSAYSERLPSEFQKRLAVFLFESPLNYELIHRFSDADARVMKWLHRQRISSQWRGDRYFEINGRRIFESNYSYSFLCFRVDLGIGTPIKEHPDERLPQGVLGTPAGPNLVADRPFFPRIRRQRAHGVAAQMRHSVIPANCIYMADLACLPDVTWASADQLDPWGTQLIYQWPSLFFYEFEDWRARSTIDEEKAKEDRRIKKYLLEVVIPFASVALGQFVESRIEAELPESLYRLEGEKGAIKIKRAAEKGFLFVEMGADGKELYQRLRTISSLRRRFDYLETVANTGVGVLGARQLAQKVLKQWETEIFQLAFPVVDSGKGETGGRVSKAKAKAMAESKAKADAEYELSKVLREHLRSYRWIINDMRKAFHAGRIFLNDVADTNRRISEMTTAETPDLTRKDFNARSDRYAIPTLERLRDALTASKVSDRLSRARVKPLPWDEYRAGEERPSARNTSSDLKMPSDGELDAAAARRLSNRILAFLARRREAKDRDGRGRGDTVAGEYCIFGLTSADLEDFCKASSTELELILELNNGKFDSTDFMRAADEARIARAYFLFIFGLAPCLPALIHLDIASRVHAERTESEKWPSLSGVQGFEDRLGEWDEFVKGCLAFVRNYRDVIEVLKFRLDLMHLLRGVMKDRYLARDENQKPAPDLPWFASDDPETFGAKLTLLPDIAFSTLGAFGLKHEAFRPRGKPDALFACDKAYGKCEDALAGEYLEWQKNNQYPTVRSVFVDVESTLLECTNFLKIIEQTPKLLDNQTKKR